MIRFKTGETRDNSGNLVAITYDQRNYPNSTVLFNGSELQNIVGNTSGIVSG